MGKIAKNVNASKCFTVLADEIRDKSTSEQLSTCVTNENILHGEFLQFLVVESLSGVDLASSILNGNILINTIYYTYSLFLQFYYRQFIC